MQGAPCMTYVAAVPPDLPAELAEVLAAWQRSPSAHPLIGDWRRLGYRRGSGPPPPSGPIVEARSLGITPDDTVDTSAVLQAALDELGAAGGGVLQLDPGRYLLERPLFVHHSNVVLRGAGRHATTL